MRNLWILAHPDDEILALHLALESANSINFVIYLTDGLRSGSTYPSELRQREAKNAWNLISINNTIIFFGSDNQLKDGSLSEGFKEFHFKSLIAIVSDLSFNRLITLDFEGGHQDHDATSLIANAIATELKVEILTFPAYRSSHPHFPLYAVMKQKNHNGSFAQIKRGRRIKLSLLSLKLMSTYRSQKLTWVGLGLFVIYKYLFGKLSIIEPNKIQDIEASVPDKFLYVQRKKAPLVDYPLLIKNLSKWISLH